MGTSAQTQRQVKRLPAVVYWRPFHHAGSFPVSTSFFWPSNEHERGDPEGHGEDQQRHNVLGVENVMAYRLAQYEAMEECGRSGLASGMVRPTNPFTTLPGTLNNPFAEQQKPLNKLFNNANSRNPLSALLSRNSIGNSAQHAWDSLFRSKRQAEEGLLEIDEAAELEKFLEDYDEFKTDIGSMIGNLTCVLTKMDMLDSALQV